MNGDHGEDSDPWDDSASSSSDSDAGMTVDQIIEKELRTADGECPPTFLRKSGANLEWDFFLTKKDNLKYVAPIKLFKHAPLANMEDFFKQNITIECFNIYVKCADTVNWIAKTVHFSGYRALVEFETFKNGKERFCWIDFCSDVPHPLGHSFSNEVLVFPPYDVRKSHPDYLNKVMELIKADTPTISSNHSKIVRKAILATQRYKAGDVVEVADKKCTGQNWLARITGIIGDRIHCTYIGRDEADAGFWFNCQSESVHDIGFSHAIGYKLAGVPINMGQIFEDNNGELISQQYPSLQMGMVLEARHPLHCYRIAASKIIKVLKYGYFTAGFESNDSPDVFEFLFHVTSAYIFPCGFSKSHGIVLSPPRREDPNRFDWNEYCAKNCLTPLPFDSLGLEEKSANSFEVGMKLEAVDICRPVYLGPATVIKVAANLLLLHFDGWSRDNEVCYQWIDCNSPDIYPLGWGALVGHELQSYPEHHKPEDEPNKRRCIPNIRF